MFDNFQQIETFFESRKKHGIKPGLDRINRLLQLLDNPQNRLNAIHVAGTNGKGSTINYIKDALMANEYKVGVFNSPSLDGLLGHIFIDNKMISEKTFTSLLNEMYSAIQELDEAGNHPTEFEIITALAFVYFAKHVDFALIEAGMGGREDTTNCFIPILSIITNVARDHIAFLGDTIKGIAYHKAGIIKENTPVIIGEMEKAALHVIEQEAITKKAHISQAEIDFNYTLIDQTPMCQNFIWSSRKNRQINVSLQMRGKHQQLNASLAIMALVKLEESGIAMDWEKVLEAIHQSYIPGRFEVVHANPTVVIDGAHNHAGVQSFIQTVLSYYPDKERHLFFAGFKDKDLDMMLKVLSKHFTTITVTTFEHTRAAEAEYLFQMLEMKNKLLSNNWEYSVDRMIKTYSDDKAIFITGSLHFIGKVRNFFVNY